MASFTDRRAQFNRRVVNRVVRPLSGRVAMWSLIEHVGRRSGQTYRTPVTMFATAEGVAVLLAYGRDRDWVRNVTAAGGALVEISGTTFAVTDPRIVSTAEAAVLVKQPWRSVVGRLGIEETLLLRRV